MSVNLSIEYLQPSYLYELWPKRGPHEFGFGLVLVQSPTKNYEDRSEPFNHTYSLLVTSTYFFEGNIGFIV